MSFLVCRHVEGFEPYKISSAINKKEQCQLTEKHSQTA
jgi:hypothetical protein